MSSARGVIGIDLGTTHSSLAFAGVEPAAEPRVLRVPQWVAGRRRDTRALLASALYAPLEGELPGAGEGQLWVAGEYARVRNQETSGRGITSAKSWLCHPGVDRLAAILPWGSSDPSAAPLLSPVEASRLVLEHLKQAFSEGGAFALEDALVVLTVPASFDPTARELTVLAAERAGLNVRLLEEPQAAFYDYLGSHGAELEAALEQRSTLSVLVCDIGGGTTDLTLIDVARDGAGLALRRSAVGRHLLLGGDNIDLALARRVEQRLGVESLEAQRFGQLLLAARAAKEALLASDAPASFPIRVVASGSNLFGSTLSAELGAAEVRELVLDGFFPLTARDELPDARRAALTTFGLPYERDPAVSRHIAQFLKRHSPGRLPDALLLNGGLFRAHAVRQRVLDLFRAWGAGEIRLLSEPDPELAVSRGAVRYGLAVLGFGPRITGGSAQGYYVAVDGKTSSGARQLLCLVPRGAQEGERHVAGARRFELLVGRPARFELYSSDTALDAPGALVELDAERFQALQPLTATLPQNPAQPDERVLVQLEGELSAAGTLEVGLRLARDGSSGVPPRGLPSASAPPASAPPAPRLSLAFDLKPGPAESVRPRSQRAERRQGERKVAEEAILRVFGPGDKQVGAREVKDLWRTLERGLGPRKTWDLELNRQLYDALLGSDGAGKEARLRSPDHERVFWMLAGYTLRPGYGHPRDVERVARLWSAFEPGVRQRDADRIWQQFWIAWRRIAGGLAAERQAQARALIDPVLAPAELKLRRSKSFKPLALAELWAFASSLERLEHARRAELGRWILDRTWSDRDPELWAHLARVGARVPAYASVHHVLPPATVERWLDQLLRERWGEVRTAAASAVLMARVTGDRARDIAPALRAEVVRALQRVSAPPEWIRAVSEHVAITRDERELWFGDDLPLGLSLVED